MSTLAPSTVQTKTTSTAAQGVGRGSDRSVARDTDLVARLIADEPQAWREFTRNYSRLAFSCIRRTLGRYGQLSENDLDEVYARFCLDLLSDNRKKLRAFDVTRGGSIKTWVAMLATNATYDYLRVAKRQPVCFPLPDNACLPSFDQSPFERVAVQEQTSKVVRALRQLKPRDIEFINLYFGEGLSAEQVAERMNISVRTVYTKHFKISAKLGSLMNDRHLRA